MNFLKLIIFFLIIFLFFINKKLYCQENESVLIIDSVSVNENNNVIIGWTFISNVDNGHFKIHRQSEDLSYIDIDTINDLETRLYVDNTVDAREKSFSYYISAHDSEGRSFASSKAHKTIFIKKIKHEICLEAINTLWDNYTVSETYGVGLPRADLVPFDTTTILLSYNNQHFEIANYTSINQDSSSVVASITGRYCVQIRSFDSSNTDITSTSNIRCLSAIALHHPEFANLLKASVVENKYIKLDFLVDDKVKNPSYILYRNLPEKGIFSPVDTIINTQSAFIYNDNNIDLSGSAYSYYFEVLDSCNREVKTSNTVSSIYLLAEQGTENENILSWNTPQIFNNNIDYYEVMRRKNQDKKFILLSKVHGNQDYFRDFITTNNQEGMSEQYEYLIKAVGITSYGLNMQDSIIVFSNYAKAEREIETFIPNAFRPESQIPQNRVFRPVIRNAIPLNYRMIIFNNWGQKVFETEQYETAWDGLINGNKATEGVYTYTIIFETQDGKKHHKQGTVTLIR